jgi:hypothetical protein
MRILALCTVVATLLAPATLLADKPNKSKHKSNGQDEQVVIAFSTDQRQATQAYFVEKHGRDGCPPGLAKKGNGCLPPGQAKKRYVVGRVLPTGVITQPPPAELSVRLGPAPAGYAYVVVDGDLVKLAVGTMLVVDAIDGLVH